VLLYAQSGAESSKGVRGQGTPQEPSSPQILGKSSKTKGQIKNKKYTILNKKITFLLEPKFSCTPSLMENTCNRLIYPSMRRANEFLVKYSTLIGHHIILNCHVINCIFGYLCGVSGEAAQPVLLA